MINLDWVHHDSKTFDEEKFMENIERKYIEKHTTHIKGYTQEYVDKLQQEINRLNNIINELETMLTKEIVDFKKDGYDNSNIRKNNLWLAGVYDEDKKILDKLKKLKGENNG